MNGQSEGTELGNREREENCVWWEWRLSAAGVQVRVIQATVKQPAGEERGNGVAREA